MTKYSTPSEEWMRKKALEEDGCEIGAGMPDHPLRVPEATMTDRVEEIEARHKVVDGDLDISPMDDCELADHEDRAFLLSTIRALQAENERLREVLGKINAIEDAEYPSEDEYGYESCHVEGYNAGLSECRKTILLALKDALKEQSNG